VSRAESRDLSFVGTGSADSDLLAGALAPAMTVSVPSRPGTDSWDWRWADVLDDWRAEIEGLPMTDRVVVCTWTDAASGAPLVDLGAGVWRRDVEWPTALWFATLAAAPGRCRDGGSVVVVVDRPAALDAPGHGPAVAVAGAVTNLVRSLAAREGGRAVRVNAVVSSCHARTGGLPGSPPPLPTFPGRVDVEVAGAVRLLLSDDAAGITGAALPATGGRW
jgi:NAD(P)-dependent dehydrogenase (short-subunit alcohol dehydrogenase family)